jgi:Zn-dependent protease with chaperone function
VTWDGLLVLALTAVAALTPRLRTWSAPASGARLLTAVALAAAAASVWVTVLVAATAVQGLPEYVAEAREDKVTVVESAPDTARLAAGLALLVVAVRVGLLFRRWHRTRQELARICGSSPESELTVLPAATPFAAAVPLAGGRILVTTGMLAALDGPGRRVLFAHERAHLRHRHHLLAAGVALAAAANPLLIPLRSTVSFLLERWADEEAAASVGSRAAAARALARAAFATPRRWAAWTFAFGGTAMAARVEALLHEGQTRSYRPNPVPVVVVSAAVAAIVIATYCSAVFADTILPMY